MFASLRPPAAAALLLFTLAAQPSGAQTQKPLTAKATPVCEPARALRLVREQLSEAKALESGAQRAAVMTRAAELLWPYEEAEARALFADAFEVASAHYREHGPESYRRKPTRPDATMPGLTVGLPDPRLTVVHAVARRDPAWAQKLAARAAEESRQRAAEAKSVRENEASDKLLSMARTFLEDNPAFALGVARESLRHAPARYLSGFFYDLARRDRAAADAFWAEALAAYSGADAASLLLLSAYPFAFSQNVGLPPGYGWASTPPPGFAPSRELQRRFVAAFLRLAERRLAEAAAQPPPPTEDNWSLPSDVELIYTTLNALESLYGAADKTYAAAAAPLRQSAAALLSERSLRRAEGSAQRKLTFYPPREDPGLIDRVLEDAEKIKDPERHDQRIVTGIQGALRTERVERLETAAEKIKDEVTRRQLLDVIYFAQVQKELKGGRLDEAARLAEKIDSIEQRAELAWELAAAESFPAAPAGPAGAEGAERTASLAEATYRSVQRAPESEEKVRALLGLAYVYVRTDPLRAPGVLSEAVAGINRLPGFDATRSFTTPTVDGKTYSFYMSNPAPGFNLAGVLRELAGRDFEAALTLAGALDDRHQRALAVLALASKCLEDAPKPPQPAPKKQAPPKKRP